MSFRQAALLYGVLQLGQASVAFAQERKERWSFSVLSGSATLSLLTDEGRAPLISFVCGPHLPGVVQVIISEPGDIRASRRLRIDLEAGSTSAIAAADPTTGLSNAPNAVLGEISTRQMQEILRSPASNLAWRVDASHTVSRPLTIVRLPHPMTRQRAEFLNFCYE